jgi:hypothetical protein
MSSSCGICALHYGLASSCVTVARGGSMHIMVKAAMVGMLASGGSVFAVGNAAWAIAYCERLPGHRGSPATRSPAATP